MIRNGIALSSIKHDFLVVGIASPLPQRSGADLDLRNYYPNRVLFDRDCQMFLSLRQRISLYCPHAYPSSHYINRVAPNIDHSTSAGFKIARRDVLATLAFF